MLRWSGLAMFLAMFLTMGGVCAAAESSSGPAMPRWDTQSDTWVATDALGRTLPDARECGPPRAGKFVGIFYFLWLGAHGHALYDNTKLIAANPERPAFGPRGVFHWWGEPLFGYYRSTDEFVIRKHAQMLSDAGVDVVFLDVTNGPTYDDAALALMKVYAEIRALGQPTPQIAFLANSSSAKVVQHVYEAIYAKKIHPELWFRWQGKPLLLAPPEGLSDELKQFFTIRRSWAWSDPKGWFADGKDKWPWLDHYPQKAGWHESPDKPEEVPVCVAQHPVSNIGRSFHDGKQPPPGAVESGKGLCFAEQWRRARQIDPELVFVTGWNEWVAQRFDGDGRQPFIGGVPAQGEAFFVDQYNAEFSRDIEPLRGGHGDNYYYQFVSEVRRFKGARAVPPLKPQPITVDGQFDDWKNVEPEYRDTLGDPVRRDALGYDNKTRLADSTGRNDIAAAKVSRDVKNVYFYVRTVKPLTPCTDPNWMLLFLDVDADAKTGWLGYDFVVNRAGVKPQSTLLERNVGGGYQWGSPVEVACRAAGNELELAIPSAALGIAGKAVTIDFKWADNIQQTGEASDFTLHGDAAPNDRFNFRVRMDVAQ